MDAETAKPTIFEALAAVQAAVKAVGKDSRNREQGYNFRGIDAVVNAVGPVLREHSVIVVPEVLDAAYRDVRTSRDKPSRECTVRVRYRFYGPSGDYVDAVVPGEAMDFGDKGTPKAMSVALRIALLQTLSLPTDEPDADSQTYERSDPWEQARAARQQQSKPAASGGTRRPAGAFDDYSGRIRGAKTPTDLDNLSTLIRDARGASRISAEEYTALGKLGKAQRAQLEAGGTPPDAGKSAGRDRASAARARMFGLFGKLGISDRDEQMSWITIRGPEDVVVTSRRDMTVEHMSAVADALEAELRAREEAARDEA